ncbi:MAG TPA: flagellar hook-length control protein FliK, partial [Phycisphaerales bacterium]|nr:flagellar hook-length control protein FliK [Phycisphaerales bacterium]
MNTSIPAIDNMFARNLVTASVPSKPPSAKNTNQFATASPDSPTPTTVPETATTDKTLPNTQSKPIDKPPQEFSRTVREEITAEEPHNANADKASAKQNPTLTVAPQPDIVQSWLTEHSLTVEHSKDRIATKIAPKAGHELAQLLVSLKADKFHPGAGQTTKPAENRAPLTTGQGRAVLKDLLPDVSRALLATDTAPGKNKNAGKIQIPDKELVGTKGTLDRQSGKKLMLEALVNGSNKTTTAGQKPAIADKPAVFGGPKTPLPTLPNDGLPTAQSKPSVAGRNVPASPEKFAIAAGKIVSNKTDTGQTPSELSDGKPRQHALNPLSDGSIFQKLNSAQVQVSTNQTKYQTKSQNPGSSGSTNSSDSNTQAVSQILSPASSYNIQPPIAERFFDVSAPAAGTAGNTSLSDTSAGISAQIQTSILQSPLRLGEGQITIRLNPPDLGKVFIKFQEQQDHITGLLEVSKMQTRVQIQQALPQIIRNLSDSGIQIKRLEVVLVETDQQGQHSFKDQSLHDGFSEQQPGT